MKTKKMQVWLRIVVVFGAGALLCGIDFGGVAKTIQGIAGQKQAPAAGNLGIDAGQIGDVFKVAGAFVKMLDNRLGPVEEFYLGREVSARLLGSYGRRLTQDSPLTQYVTRVGATMALGSRAPYLYRPYTFIVLDSQEINAFSAPGGIIFVTTGMLKFLKDEDELAGVLGHEVAHVELRHGVKAIEQEGKIRFLDTTKDVAVKEVGGGSAEAQLFDQLTGPVVDALENEIRNGYSVEQESEADLRSMEIASAAGYDPKALVRVIARFKETTSSYGGAKYPQDREKLAADHLSTLPGANENVLGLARAERFQAAVKNLN